MSLPAIISQFVKRIGSLFSVDQEQMLEFLDAIILAERTMEFKIRKPVMPDDPSNEPKINNAILGYLYQLTVFLAKIPSSFWASQFHDDKNIEQQLQTVFAASASYIWKAKYQDEGISLPNADLPNYFGGTLPDLLQMEMELGLLKTRVPRFVTERRKLSEAELLLKAKQQTMDTILSYSLQDIVAVLDEKKLLLPAIELSYLSALEMKPIQKKLDEELIAEIQNIKTLHVLSFIISKLSTILDLQINNNDYSADELSRLINEFKLFLTLLMGDEQVSFSLSRLPNQDLVTADDTKILFDMLTGSFVRVTSSSDNAAVSKVVRQVRYLTNTRIRLELEADFTHEGANNEIQKWLQQFLPGVQFLDRLPNRYFKNNSDLDALDTIIKTEYNLLPLVMRFSENLTERELSLLVNLSVVKEVGFEEWDDEARDAILVALDARVKAKLENENKNEFDTKYRLHDSTYDIEDMLRQPKRIRKRREQLHDAVILNRQMKISNPLQYEYFKVEVNQRCDLIYLNDIPLEDDDSMRAIYQSLPGYSPYCYAISKQKLYWIDKRLQNCEEVKLKPEVIAHLCQALQVSVDLRENSKVLVHDLQDDQISRITFYTQHTPCCYDPMIMFANTIIDTPVATLQLQPDNINKNSHMMGLIFPHLQNVAERILMGQCDCYVKLLSEYQSHLTNRTSRTASFKMRQLLTTKVDTIKSLRKILMDKQHMPALADRLLAFQDQFAAVKSTLAASRTAFGWRFIAKLAILVSFPISVPLLMIRSKRSTQQSYFGFLKSHGAEFCSNTDSLLKKNSAVTDTIIDHLTKRPLGHRGG